MGIVLCHQLPFSASADVIPTARDKRGHDDVEVHRLKCERHRLVVGAAAIDMIGYCQARLSTVFS
jgi:hypothetical protein